MSKTHTKEKFFTLTPLKKFEDERGKVLQMLREDSTLFKRFGEIYFSFSNEKVIKGWYKHKINTLNFALIQGKIKLVLYYYNSKLSCKWDNVELILSQNNYCLVTIQPLVWYSFKNIGNEISILANCSTFTHNPYEIDRMPIKNDVIPYNWFS